jgi:two-component system sensor histidine kinase/response regulator
MSSIKILIVDDVEANRVSLQYLIHEFLEDVDLFLASSGEEALKLTFKNEIDIIILDIQMPGMDGFDTAKFLKSNPRTQNIPIIFLTAAFKEEEFQQKGFEIGAIDYLTKPIENLQFVNKLKLYVEVILKNKQLEQVNENLYDLLQKEIELKNKIQKQQLELIEQSKMAALGEMISNIAHQWRQPLSVISTCASGLQLNIELGMDTKEDTHKKVDMIVKTTKNLSHTIDTFRDFTRKDKLAEFDLTELVEKCIENESSLIEEFDINVITELEDNVRPINLPNSLLQALMNIFMNSKEALEKIDDNKYIFITTTREDDHAIIKIKDNGGGIKTEHINKVFEPYFTTKHQAHGIGLGLNVVYKIVKDTMHGKIRVRNSKFSYDDKEFEGAEFIITVPLFLKDD